MTPGPQEQELLPAALQFLPPTKTREPDEVIRLTHIETLLLLCTTYWGREYLRTHGVYEIVRTLHENETVDKVSQHHDCAAPNLTRSVQVSEYVERLVNYLKGEETAETKADGKTSAVADEDEQIVEV